MSFTVIGGRLAPEISIAISGKLPVSAEDVKRNNKHVSSLGLKTYREIPAASPSRPHLAVIGGGPSIKNNIEAIKSWPGDIWAINGAWQWCADQGIDATFFAVDPHPIVAKWAKGAKRAILEACCDPYAFEILRDAEVYTFDCGMEKGAINAAGSAASATPHLACRLKYHSVTLFGCESSFPAQATHAYQHEDRPEVLLIECDGGHYLTAPDYYIQAMLLADYIRQVPEFIKEESGGLLRAMIKAEGKHGLRWVSDAMARGIQRIKAEPKAPDPQLELALA